MPYPDNFSVRALDRHEGRDEDDARVEAMIVDDQLWSQYLRDKIQAAIDAVEIAEFWLGWPARGMDRPSTLAALRECLPQPEADLLAERTAMARERISNGDVT